jgi:hypothetical protein
MCLQSCGLASFLFFSNEALNPHIHVKAGSDEASSGQADRACSQLWLQRTS